MLTKINNYAPCIEQWNPLRTPTLLSYDKGHDNHLLSEKLYDNQVSLALIMLILSHW